jgi:transcriptional regulator with GAF, ATPase, and Fis domain
VTTRKKAFEEIEALRDELHKENILLREELGKTSMFEEVIGTSSVLQMALARAAKVAPTDSTALILGETGTGKELIARAIHKRSKRSERPFVSVNCAAIPSSLIMSELFGHEKGAFTGALQRRPGRFELAEGGTLFLDEIGDLPAETQIALLRVLQEREFERVGGTEVLRADVRVIAATNRDLQAAIADGAFRSDLYYRLNVFPITVPPLRERKEDVPLLVNYFIDRFAKRAGKKIKHIQKKALEVLQDYSWPGNVRELQNVIERSIIISEANEFSIDKSWVANEPVPPRPLIDPTSTERKRIETALTQSNGKVSGPNGAAARLGIPSSTLESKIRALRINKFQFKGV